MDEVKTEKELVSINDQYLEERAKIGMEHVDPKDIRPPQILLIQKSSDSSQFVDVEGKNPKVGEFFHTGVNIILKDFECYILYAYKGEYTSKIKPEEGKKPMYQAIGATPENMSLFMMNFRSSAIYTLSPLFTFSVSVKRPMYSIKVKFETKELKGEKGTWFIPVCRITGPENDEGQLRILEKMARSINIDTVDIKDEEMGEIESKIPKTGTPPEEW